MSDRLSSPEVDPQGDKELRHLNWLALGYEETTLIQVNTAAVVDE